MSSRGKRMIEMVNLNVMKKKAEMVSVRNTSQCDVYECITAEKRCGIDATSGRDKADVSTECPINETHMVEMVDLNTAENKDTKMVSVRNTSQCDVYECTTAEKRGEIDATSGQDKADVSTECPINETHMVEMVDLNTAENKDTKMVSVRNTSQCDVYECTTAEKRGEIDATSGQDKADVSTECPINETHMVEMVDLNSAENGDTNSTLDVEITILEEDDENNVIDSDNDPEYVPPSERSVSPINDNDTQSQHDTSGLFESSHKRKRRRIAVPGEWIKNKRKHLKQSGQAYTSIRGKRVEHKSIKPKDCSKCPRKCNINFTENDRQTIFDAYWNMANIDKQRIYLLSLVEYGKKECRRTNNTASRRVNTNKYYLFNKGIKLQVCFGFFLATLNISDKFVRSIIEAKKNDKLPHDNRGHHPPALKIPDEAKKIIFDHIDSFPKMPSHYARKDSTKDYLASDLNVNIMYNLYVDMCKERGIKFEKLWLYRDVFNKQFNLSFHVPKNDMCDTCYKFSHLSDEEKVEQKQVQDAHIRRKEMARNKKNAIKAEAAEQKCHLAEFDLQAVCYCPKTNAKALFYKRRLAVYDFTVYDTTTKAASCYMWHEGTAKRGSIEVASCIFNYIKSRADGKEWNFFSDTCGGQNRNLNVATMFLYAVRSLEIPTINQMFFESGHSQMECDSVHATIEKKTKHLDIYHPSGWYSAVQMASSKYKVIEMEQQEFLDFGEVQKKIIKNRKIDSEGQQVCWLKIKWLQYRKEFPNEILFKYEFDEDFRKFNVIRRPARNQQHGDNNMELNPKYHVSLPITEEKLNDLKDLCKTGIIRQQYHSFYNQLLSGSTADLPINEEEF